MNTKSKSIGVVTKDYKKFKSALNSSLLSIFHFDDLLDLEGEIKLDTKYDLFIVDTFDSFTTFKNLQTDGVIDKTAPCIIISNNLCENPSTLLTEISHFGVIKVHRNYYGDYAGLGKVIKSSLNPLIPIKQSRILFVIPVYNEEARINHVIDFLHILLRIIKTQNIDAKVRFVNDGSDDNTQELISTILNRLHGDLKGVQIDDFLELENLEKNTQKAGIYHAGFKNSNANYYFILDSDNSFFEDDIVKAISIIEDGYFELIQATKDHTAEKRPLIRKALSFCKRICTYLFLPAGIFDSQTGFKLLSAKVARQAMPYIRNEYGFAADLQLLNICKRMKFRALQLPVKCIDQEGSHVNPIRDAQRFFLSLLKIATKKEVYHEFK